MRPRTRYRSTPSAPTRGRSRLNSSLTVEYGDGWWLDQTDKLKLSYKDIKKNAEDVKDSVSNKAQDASEATKEAVGEVTDKVPALGCEFHAFPFRPGLLTSPPGWGLARLGRVWVAFWTRPATWPTSWARSCTVPPRRSSPKRALPLAAAEHRGVGPVWSGHRRRTADSGVCTDSRNTTNLNTQACSQVEGSNWLEASRQPA